MALQFGVPSTSNITHEFNRLRRSMDSMFRDFECQFNLTPSSVYGFPSTGFGVSGVPSMHGPVDPSLVFDRPVLLETPRDSMSTMSSLPIVGGSVSNVAGFPQRLPTWAPNCDISETDKLFVIRCDLPGMTKDLVTIKLNADILVIKGERKFDGEKKFEGENVRCCERSYGMFHRHVRLPVNVDAEQIIAMFENGVLTVHVPKKVVSATKQILIK